VKNEDGFDTFDSTVQISITKTKDGKIRLLDGRKSALLIVLTGSRMGHRSILGDEPFIIGRGTGVELMLQEDSISRQHARIEWTGHKHRLVDLKSTNGCFVNYQRISERDLKDGDQIQIGKALLKYLAGDNIEAAYHEVFERLVRHDPLTGALNKVAFDEELRVAMSGKAVDDDLSLVLFDLDHFKSVNDTHGHTAGDKVLREVASAVQSLVDEGPHRFARVGGEEFAVIARGLGSAGAAALAESIRTTVATTTFDFEGTTIPVTLSLGVAEFRDPEQSARELYERADKQLYAAKHGGRNRVSTEPH
jgi:diguanylate cyclase (GGDEF)-like protein